MELFETTVHYNSKPLIKSAIELSKHHFNDPKFKHSSPLEMMVTIGLGRQTGQTTAIKELIGGDCDLANNTLVVCHNHQIAEQYTKHAITACNIKGVINSALGARLALDTTTSRHIGIIFDVCSSNEIVEFFANIYPYIDKSNIRFVVNVSPLYVK